MRGALARIAFFLGTFGIVASAIFEAAPPGVRDIASGWGALLVIAALVLRAERTPVSEQAAPSGRLHGAVALLIGACAGAAAIRGWLSGGVPAFAHDWKWPLDLVQLSSWPTELRSLWLPWADGAPAVQELAGYPVSTTAFVLGKLFGSSDAALVVLLLLISAIGGFGAARLARIAGLPIAMQAAFAGVYPLLPQVFVRLCSGHLNWLLGFSLMPLILAIALDAGAGRGGLLGLLWGAAAAQVQFLAFVGAAILATGRVWSKKAGIAAIIACALQAPMIAALALGHPSSAYAAAHATAPWQAAQSSPVGLALAGAADPAQYFEGALPHAELLLALLLLFALTGMWRAVPQLRGVGVLTLLAGLWSSGLRGPIGSPIIFLFQGFLPASAFREFSHAEVLVGAPLLLFAGIGARALFARYARVSTLAMLAVVAPALMPALTGQAAVVDPPVRLSADYARAIDRIAQLGGDGQVLWLPAIQPMTALGTRGGADSIALPVDAHAPFVEYQPMPMLTFVLEQLSGGSPSSCGLLGDLGVQAVAARRDVRSTLAWAQPLRGPISEKIARTDGLSPIYESPQVAVYRVPCYHGTVTWAAASVLHGDLSDVARLALHGATDEITLPPDPPPGTVIAPAPLPDYSSVDPSHGWISIDDDEQELPLFCRAWTSTVLSSNPDAVVGAPYALAADPGSPFRWQTSGEVRAELSRGKVAVWLTAIAANHVESDHARPSPTGLPRASIRNFAHTLPGGALMYAGKSLVVLHQHSFGAWRATMDGDELAAYPADGVATGWIVDGPGTVTISYAGPPIWLLWSIVALGFAACAFVEFRRAAKP